MRHLKTSTALALALTMGSATAYAATDPAFSELDADSNLEVNETEFEQISQETFAAWDENDDERIGEDELFGGLFSEWDDDGDGQLAAMEYRGGYDSWFGDEDQPAFEDIDADGDGFLTEEDFASTMADTGLTASFDASGEGVDWAAFHASLFNAYDQDEDERLTEMEYGEFDSTEMAANDVAEEEYTGAIGSGAAGSEAIRPDEVVALADWQTDALYNNGYSVEYLMDEMPVYGDGGDEIGSIENVVFSNDGRVLSIVAEVGGFWDMFDTHVNVPWEEVEMTAGRLVIPVTQDNVEDYSVFKTGYLMGGVAASDVRVVEDDLAVGPQVFRATELIGDYARIRDGDEFANYGYVNDLIIKDGGLEAVVVSPDTAYGAPGPYAYPYYGFGWAAAGPFYDMPYGRQDVAEADRMDYGQFDTE